MKPLRPVGKYDTSGRSLSGEPDLQQIVSDIPHPEEDRIVRYLKSGLGIAGCGLVFKDPLDRSAKMPNLGADVYTDGVWEWSEYLSYYVQKYHAKLPAEFTCHMRENNWTIPKGLDPRDYEP